MPHTKRFTGCHCSQRYSQFILRSILIQRRRQIRASYTACRRSGPRRRPRGPALITLEPHWAVLDDLVEPAPDQWGYGATSSLDGAASGALPLRAPANNRTGAGNCKVEDRLRLPSPPSPDKEARRRQDVYVRALRTRWNEQRMVSCGIGT